MGAVGCYGTSDLLMTGEVEERKEGVGSVGKKSLLWLWEDGERVEEAGFSVVDGLCCWTMDGDGGGWQTLSGREGK